MSTEILSHFSRDSLESLYGSTVNCVSVLKMLSPLSRILVMRFLYTDSIPLEFIRKWTKSPNDINTCLWELKKLYILDGNKQSLWLKQSFQLGLRRGIEQDAQDRHTVSEDIKALQEYAFHKHQHNLQCLVKGKFPVGFLKQFMISAGLMSKNLVISHKGFQFLLQDVKTQIWTILSEFILSSNDPVEALSFIFQCSLLNLGGCYSHVNYSSLKMDALKLLSELGAVRLDAEFYYPTHISTCLLSESIQLGKEHEGSLILETNYKMYCYTKVPLEIDIIGLFSTIKGKFANMVYCVITQSSMMNAFSKGITSDQIVLYLERNAHSLMRSRFPVIPSTVIDQIKLWERDRNRIDSKKGYLYHHFLNKSDFDKVVAYSKEIGSLLYHNSAKRTLVVSVEGHSRVKAFASQQ